MKNSKIKNKGKGKLKELSGASGASFKFSVDEYKDIVETLAVNRFWEEDEDIKFRLKYENGIECRYLLIDDGSEILIPNEIYEFAHERAKIYGLQICVIDETLF